MAVPFVQGEQLMACAALVHGKCIYLACKGEKTCLRKFPSKEPAFIRHGPEPGKSPDKKKKK